MSFTSISLCNESTNFDYIPGQFCFFQFVKEDISMESHPYTICGTYTEGHITILVKSLGDYTKNLYQKLTINTTALIEGPYGNFDHKLGKEKQIWIAGGVGIAPFVSWCRDFENNDMLRIYPNPTNGIVYIDFLNKKKSIDFKVLMKFKRGRFTALQLKLALDDYIMSRSNELRSLVGYNIALLRRDLSRNVIFEKYNIPIDSILKRIEN